MALLIISGLDRPELSKYLQHIPLDGSTMQQSMKATPYFSMLNDIGDIFEAVAAIASYETPKADPIRRHLQMHKFDANRIEAYLGALSEYANLLIRRCGLSEQEVFEMLKLSHMDARVKNDHNSVEGRVATTLKRPVSAIDTELESVEPAAAGRPWSLAASSQASPVPEPAAAARPWSLAASSQASPVPEPAAAGRPWSSAASSQASPVPEPAPAGRPWSLAASSQASPVPRLPPVVEDLRFSHIKRTKWFKCDRCTTRIDFGSQSYPHDGDWVVSKRDEKIATFQRRWEAGEIFCWYCIPCLAHAESHGTGSQARQDVRVARGLTMHAENRAARYAERQRRGR